MNFGPIAPTNIPKFGIVEFWPVASQAQAEFGLLSMPQRGVIPGKFIRFLRIPC